MGKSPSADDAFAESPLPPRQPPPLMPRGDDDFAEDVPARRSRSPRPYEQEDRTEDDRPRRRDAGDDVLSGLIPYKNGMALAAYYCGVFGLIPCAGAVLGPLSIIFGVMGLKRVTADPRARGTGHAIAGIVLGSLVILAHVIVFILILGGVMSHR